MQLVGTQQALAPALVAAQYTKVAVSVTAGAGASGRDDSGAEASGAVELAALAARGGAGALGDDSAEVQALVGLARETVWSEGFSAALAGREAMLRSLLRMGVRFTSFQELALKAAQEAGLSRALEAVEAALADGRTFLVGERVSLADVVLACGLLPAFACLLSDLQRASFPRATRWFSACTSQPEFAAVLGEVRLPCEAREGGQIDARPDPRVAARAADFSIALNRSAPKEHVHRKADKPEAAKAEDAAAGGAAGAGAAAAAGSAPAVKSTCAVSAVSARAPHALFQSRVGTPASAEEDAAIVAAVEARLAALGLAFRTYAHEEVLTVEQQAVHTQALGVEGVLTKNLFLKGKKGRDEGDSRMWLLVIRADRQVDLKKLSKAMLYPAGLRFGEAPALLESLGVVQGAVSLLATANDPAHTVRVAVDKALLEAGQVNFHPLTNRATTTMPAAAILKWLEATGHAYEVMDLDAL